MQNSTPLEPVNKNSKFILNTKTMQLLWGKLPTYSGQLWDGENHKGEKMQFAGNDDGDPTPYWGW